VTLLGQHLHNLGSDEAAASNHDDLHVASPTRGEGQRRRLEDGRASLAQDDQAGAPCPHSLPVQLLMKARGKCFRIIAQTQVYMSRISVTWPVAGDSRRRGLGESAEFPTDVKEALAMCVRS
jgi:hypothetical protein